MTEEKQPDEDARQRLRQRAEEKLQEQEVETAKPSKKELQHLVHELQVHQIELMMQNEELLQTQEQLNQSREQYADLYNSAPVGYLTLDEKGIIVRANQTFANMLGTRQEDVVSRPLTQFVHHDDQDTFYLYRRRSADKKGRQTCDLRLRGANASQFDAQLDSIVLFNGKGNHRISRVIVTDVTKRKQVSDELEAGKLALEKTLVQLTEAQAQMIARERMAAVGQLAAGVAHDFNNILAVIQIYTDLLLHPDIPLEKRNSNLHIIQQQVSHASSLTQQILDFSRVKMVKLKSVDLHDFLPEISNMLRVAVPDSIRFSMQLLVESGLVQVDADRLQQVLLNLVINAREAMPTGGSLQILLDIEQVREQQPESVSSSGRWAKITVQDTGAGIEKAMLPFIFEPFFTTRGPTGSGLGLAQVYGIVKQHGGAVSVDSELGVGSAFTIWLPLLSSTNGLGESQDEGEDLPDPQAHHGETIVLVDDNTMLREALATALKGLGYTLLSFSNAQDALACCEQGNQKISLVITDLEMPEMGGMEFARALNRDFPGIKIIILSGYSSDYIIDQLEQFEDIQWLQKPVELSVIGQTVAQILET